MNGINTDAVPGVGLPGASGSESNALGQEDYLQLMVAQLRNQDPFEPLQNGEFMGQLAEFGTVSGVQDMQSSISQLAESLHSNQALQAATLVGQTVLAASDVMALEEQGETSGAINLPAASTGVSVTIHDSAGNLIRKLELGELPAGSGEFTWDGMTETGERAAPGDYQLQAAATLNGEPVAVSTLVAAEVSGVTLQGAGGDLNLNLDDGRTVSFANVVQILQ